MSKHWIRVMVPPSVSAPRGADWAARIALWFGPTSRRGGAEHQGAVPAGAAFASRIARWWSGTPHAAEDLRSLARDLEPEQPALATTLRGIALHEDANGPLDVRPPTTLPLQRSVE